MLDVDQLPIERIVNSDLEPWATLIQYRGSSGRISAKQSRRGS